MFIRSDARPIIPKNMREIIIMLVLTDLAITSAFAKPPAIIIVRITTRLNVDVQNDNTLFSF